MVWLLLPLESSSDRSVYYLPRGTTTVGRAHSDIVVANDNTISRKQCEFIVTGESSQACPMLRLKDLSRYNTTYHNGSELSTVDRSVLLSDGDVVKIGSASEGFQVLEIVMLAYCFRPSDGALCASAGMQTVPKLDDSTHCIASGAIDPCDPTVLSAVVLGKPILSSTVAEFLTNCGKCSNLATFVRDMGVSLTAKNVEGRFLRWISTSYRPMVSTTSTMPDCGKLMHEYLSSPIHGVNRRLLFSSVNFKLQSDEARDHLEQPLCLTSASLSLEPDDSLVESTVFVGGAKPSPSQVCKLKRGKAYYATIEQVVASILLGEEKGQFSLFTILDVIEHDEQQQVGSAKLRSKVSLRPLETSQFAGRPSSVRSTATVSPSSSAKRSSSRRSQLGGLIKSHHAALSGDGGWHIRKRPWEDPKTSVEDLHLDEGSKAIPVVSSTRNIIEENTREPTKTVNFKAFRRRGCQDGAMPVRKGAVQLVTFTPDLADGYGDTEDDMRLFDEVPRLHQRYLARRL